MGAREGTLTFEGCIVAVHDLDKAAEFHAAQFGYEFGPTIVREHAAVVTRIGSLGPNKLQLMAPAGEGPIAKFLEKRGEGLYALIYATTDIDAELERSLSTGPPPMRPEITELDEFREFLLHPRDCHGVMTVLREWR